jgi:amino acid transporter
LSSFKVITIVGIIIFSLCIALGAGPAHQAKGFRPGFYTWENPGAFAEAYTTGALGKFLGFWSVMVNATFAYLGTELVGVTAAEAASRKSIPKAIKLTFYRILFFYILSVLLVGMIVPYNHPQLAFANKVSGNANASPFVVAAEIAGVEVLVSLARMPQYVKSTNTVATAAHPQRLHLHLRLLSLQLRSLHCQPNAVRPCQ